MRHALIALALLAGPTLAQAPGKPDPKLVAAGTYRVDPNHTQVTWTVNHMGVSMLQGQFGASGGQLTLDPARPQASRLEVAFDAAQLSTTSAPFSNHLKGKDFFDVAAYPTARFVSRNVQVRGNKATITGDLTIKNVTKPVILDATFVGTGKSPRGGKLNFGFRATGQVNRSDFGLGLAAPMVSDKVDLEINAAFEAA